MVAQSMGTGAGETDAIEWWSERSWLDALGKAEEILAEQLPPRTNAGAGLLGLSLVSMVKWSTARQGSRGLVRML